MVANALMVKLVVTATSVAARVAGKLAERPAAKIKKERRMRIGSKKLGAWMD